MQPPQGPSGESPGGKAKDRTREPLPPLVSAALEPGTTLAERLARIAAHGGGRERYTTLGEVAQGGMGRILRVWDEGLAREVAMKVVPRELPAGASEEERADHERRLARFLDEARITAQLDHPGIVPVYEIGLDETGAVFFTMPLVRGRDLKSVFALVHRGAEGWTPQRAIAVMHTVCLTVAFAHSKGVVHRDLKPENVMVGPFGEAYVMDWGLALLLGRAEREGIVGTPAYMAPEQAAGQSAAVGPRADVYSLGAMLYELFARRVPHATSLETGAGEPGSLERVLAAPPRPLGEIAGDVPPELAAICAKAMAHEPSARYASALEMAEDLAAWLDGRAVSALDTGPWTRIRKWRARNRALTLALDSLAAVLLVGGAAFFLQQRRLLREVQAKNAEVRAAAYVAGLSAADLGLRAHDAEESRRRLAACDDELRGWEWHHLALRADPSARVLRGHGGAVRTVAVSPDGRLVASGSDDWTVRLWDPEAGVERATLAGHAGFVTEVAFAPDGARLASASRDKSVRLWRAHDGVLERVLYAHEADVEALAFAHDGSLLATGDREGHLCLSRVSNGELLARSQPEGMDGIVGLSFLASSGTLAAAYQSGFVRLFEPRDLALRLEVQVARTALNHLAADAAGAFLAVTYERTARVLDAATLVPLAAYEEHDSKVDCVAFSPEGARLATGGYDDVLRLFELGSEQLPAELGGHDADVKCVAFFPDGRRLVTGSEDASLRIWDLAGVPEVTLGGSERAAVAPRERPISALAFAPDGRRLLTGGHDGRLRLFDVRSGAAVGLLAASGIVDCVAWSARGTLAYGCGERAPRLVEAAGLAPGPTLEPAEGFPRTVLFERGGARLFTRDSKGSVSVHDLASGTRLAALETEDDETTTLALAPDGALLVAGTSGGEVLVWDARTLARTTSWQPGGTGVGALAFSPDGAHLAVGCGRSIALLATQSGALERRLEGHESAVSCLAFSPDGSRLASGSHDHTLRIWDPASEHSLLTLHGHGGHVTAVAFDPRGEVLASSSTDGTLRLWRTAGVRGGE